MTASAAKPDWADRTEQRLLDAAIPRAANLGMTPTLLKAAGAACGLSEGDVGLLLPNGPADLVALRDETGPAPGSDLWLDRWLFGRGVAVQTVWCGGVECVSGGRHRDRDRVVAGFRRAVEAIQA